MTLNLDLAEATLLTDFEHATQSWTDLANAHPELFSFATKTIKKGTFTYTKIVLRTPTSVSSQTLKSRGGHPYSVKKD